MAHPSPKQKSSRKPVIRSTLCSSSSSGGSWSLCLPRSFTHSSPLPSLHSRFSTPVSPFPTHPQLLPVLEQLPLVLPGVLCACRGLHDSAIDQLQCGASVCCGVLTMSRLVATVSHYQVLPHPHPPPHPAYYIGALTHLFTQLPTPICCSLSCPALMLACWQGKHSVHWELGSAPSAGPGWPLLAA
jgi:hypothetical protein